MKKWFTKEFMKASAVLLVVFLAGAGTGYVGGHKFAEYKFRKGEPDRSLLEAISSSMFGFFVVSPKMKLSTYPEAKSEVGGLGALPARNFEAEIRRSAKSIEQYKPKPLPSPPGPEGLMVLKTPSPHVSKKDLRELREGIERLDRLRRRSRGERRFMRRLERDLNLNPAQRADVDRALERHYQRIRDIRRSMRPQINSIMQEIRRDVRSFLDDEQKTSFDEMVRKFEERRKRRWRKFRKQHQGDPAGQSK